MRKCPVEYHNGKQLVLILAQNTQCTTATTYASEAVVPLVNNMSVILIVQLVGKVCAAAGCTKHGNKAGIIAAFLHTARTISETHCYTMSR